MRAYEHIQVHIVDWLPVTIRGLTIRTTDDEDFYCVLLNGKLGREALNCAYDHELSHIDNQDFDSMYLADQIEALRHAG